LYSCRFFFSISNLDGVPLVVFGLFGLAFFVILPGGASGRPSGHFYVLATAGTNIEATRPLQYGTSLVLIAMVLGMNLVAIVWRARLRKRMK
jgi:ABC-type phosphate transport system permease subunit